ncbi:MAG TPA: efflux RND transporter permease subunit [Vicinamibacterales bacterium]|jgi:hydrophobic/amphiphilic exporter-1 (mainly G- bacteria), HAE1 family|nr:efflux RND transporter permease subunit [Vicinamibacterales bacterium]
MSLAEFCVRRPAFTTMLVMAFVVTGIFSFRDLSVDLLPRADPATVAVALRLPGASPEELTTSVVEPVEQALSSISGIDEMQGRITEGNARITIRFVLEREIDDAAQDVREKVATAVRLLPPQVEPPVITKVDPDSDPILSLAVSGSLSIRALTEIADKQIKRGLETVDGVGEVTISGGRLREIHIVLDIEKLNAHGLTVERVRDAIVSENVEIPGGRIDQGDAELTLRTLGRVESPAQFADIVIANANGTPIRVRDVATVEDSTEEVRTGALFDGERTIVVDVRRQSGQNTVEVIDGVKAKLAQLRRSLPSELKMTVTRDDSAFIRASIASLEEHLIFGSLLASLVIMAFIRNFRVVLVASLAIPASIIASFALIRAGGFTLNSMTLLGLTLAVGIVIDDAIVVLENIYRHIDEEGAPPFRAAIEGTKEVTLAVAATSLSLVVIFMPVAFMTGYSQRFIYPFGLTMAFAVMVSLLVSLTLTPMLSARVLTRSERLHRHGEGFFGRIERAYGRSLEWSLDHRAAVVAISLLVFGSTFVLSPLVGRSFLPNEDQGEFQLTVDAPEGTSLQGMEKMLNALTPKLMALEGVAHVMPTIFERVNHSHIFVELKPVSERKLTQDQVADAVRKMMAAYPSYKPAIFFKTPIGGGENTFFPIQVSLMGPDLRRLADYGLKLLPEVAAIPGVIDAKVSVNLSNPEVRVAVDRQRAGDLGVRLGDLATALRLMVSGEDEISSYREAGERYPVKIRVREDQRADINSIGGLMVASAREPVRIDNVAVLQRGFGPTSIQRLNRQYSVGLYSDVKPGHPLDQALREVNARIRALNLPPDYTVKFGGQAQLLDETTRNMVLAIGLASVFIYMVLAAQFESFVQPLIIMTVLPLSVPFALLTLYMTGRVLNLWSALGVLLLLGIVKKNSILQVDYTNVLRRQGMPLREALVQASLTRLRPILMTTAAIIAGLIPTALGVGAGATQRADIAVTIVGGQTLCLFLTLLLVPVSYSLAEEGLERLRHGWRRRATAPLAEER